MPLNGMVIHLVLVPNKEGDPLCLRVQAGMIVILDDLSPIEHE